ncbi:dethiobiotin synthase [Thiorhodococcus fuscus]|uniref:ATP-dependent dethiobiotin synthetase BioD n=1 Tax=Thiorhodococcus fuscus TaxID=527200 RepID=A0ABW4Y534_9GAMM
MTGIFITGTDTGCGKTEISLGLMASIQAQGASVLGMKPVASGCEPGPGGLRNEDASRLLAQGSSSAPYGIVNPYAFEPPIAPHLAAAEAGIQIDLTSIRTAYRSLCQEADLVVVEGVGGWRVPLGSDFFVSDIPAQLDLPVVLVVGLKLGAINHALLTAESIRASGARLAGWVANQVEPEMLMREANLATLAALIEAPCLGIVPWQKNPEPNETASYLDPTLLGLDLTQGNRTDPNPIDQGLTDPAF